MSTVFINPNWRMPRNANQNRQANYSMFGTTSQKVDISNVPLGSGSWTISFWYQQSNFASAFDVWDMEYGSAGGLKIRQQNGGSGNTYLYFQGNSNVNGSFFQFFTQKVITDDNWFHIILRYNQGTDYRLYVNGVLSGLTTSKNSEEWPATRNLELFDGVINVHLDQFCVFDYALSDTATTIGDTATGQIADLWGGGTATSNPMALPRTPKAYYPLGTSAWRGNSGQYLVENNAIGDYVFDFPAAGVNSAVSANFTLFNGASEACVSAWFKTSTQQSGKCLFSSPFSTGGNRFDLYLQTNTFTSYLKLGTSGATALSSSTINYYDDKWHNVVVTYDGVNHKIYYDGNEVATAAKSGALATSTYNKLEIGRYGTSFSNNVDAEISNVLAWTKGLNSTEIETLYNYGSPIQTLANIPQSSNLKAWYKLDASGIYSNTSTEWSVDNNAFPTTFKSAFTFDNDQIDSGSNLGISGASARTFSAWLRTTDAGAGYDVIVATGNSANTGNNFELDYRNGVIMWERWGLGVLGAITVNDGFWHHACITYDGNILRLYVDGSEDTAGDFPYTIGATTSTDTPVRIGGMNHHAKYFPGEISNVAIYNTALSASNVSTLYNNGVPQTTIYGSPVVHYKLDESETYNSSSNQWEITNNALQDKAYSFNGSSNIQIPNNTSIQTANWTIGFWVKGHSQSGTYLFNNSPNGWNIKASGNDIEIYVGTSVSAARTASNALNGEWNYIVFNYDGNFVRGSMNGSYLGYASGSGQAYDSSNLFIGSYSDGTNGFVGEIAQILLWNARFNGNNEGWDATTQKPTTSPPETANLVSWWKLDTATITDSQGSNTGTNNGATLIDTNIGRPSAIGAISTGMNASSLISTFVNATAGDSSNMSQSNLIQSDLQTVAPYSKYAISFDGTDYIDLGRPSALNFTPSVDAFSISCWINISSGNTGCIYSFGAGPNTSNTATQIKIGVAGSPNAGKIQAVIGGSETYSTNTVTDSTWKNVIVTVKGSTGTVVNVYLNGSNNTAAQGTVGNVTANSNGLIGARTSSNPGFFFNGTISNVSIWNYELNASQVREVYNEGLPSDLNSFSGTAPVAWWQLGENSSYIGGATNPWTFADEIGSNNGASGNLPEVALVNGVSTTANGVSTGMSEGSLVGNAPYSTANAISSNMSATAKGTNVP